MFSEKLVKAFNGQFNAEYYSSYLYLSMSAWFSSKDLAGFASWMRFQAEEELMHAMKFFDYIGERGADVTLTAVDAPQTDWESPLAAFEHVAEHEAKVTGLINSLMDLAVAESDHAAQSFLRWFVDEQVEEEDTAGRVVSQLRLLGDSGPGLFMMDQEMAKRPKPGTSAE